MRSRKDSNCGQANKIMEEVAYEIVQDLWAKKSPYYLAIIWGSKRLAFVDFKVFSPFSSRMARRFGFQRYKLFGKFAPMSRKIGICLTFYVVQGATINQMPYEYNIWHALFARTGFPYPAKTEKGKTVALPCAHCINLLPRDIARVDKDWALRHACNTSQ